MTETLTDTLALAAFVILFGQVSLALAMWAAKLNREAKDSALAKLVGACSRVAGRINDMLGGVPLDMDRRALQAATVAEGVAALRAEFADSIRKVGGNDDKLAGIIVGELGKLQSGEASRR